VILAPVVIVAPPSHDAAALPILARPLLRRLRPSRRLRARIGPESPAARLAARARRTPAASVARGGGR
jgi:hypothetical protein